MNRLFYAIILCQGFLLAGCMPQVCLDCRTYEKNGQLKKAISFYELCLKENIKENMRDEYRQNLQNLKSKIANDSLAKAQSLLGAGRTLSQFDEAIELLNTEIQYDDEENRIAKSLEDYRKQRVRLNEKLYNLLSIVEQKVLRYQWSEALQSIYSAQYIDPDNSEVIEREDIIIKNRNQYFEQIIEKACMNDEYAEASHVFNDFLNSEPKPANEVSNPLKQLVATTRDRVVHNRAKFLINKKKYFTAYTMISDSGAAKCDDLLEIIGREGCRYYLNLAYKEQSNVNYFLAYIAIIKAEIVDSQNNEEFTDEIFTLRRDLTDQVDDSIQIKIGIAGFEAPTAEPDIGKEFSDTLVSYLDRLLPYGLKLDERKKIEFLLQEHETGPMVVLAGLKLAIFGNISMLEINTKTVEWENTAKVIASEEDTPNPKYELFISKYGIKTKKWPFIPPSTLKKYTYNYVKYNKGEERMEGTIIVSPRIYDAESASLSEPKTFCINQEIRDTFQDGVPDAMIKEDALELSKSNLQMKQELKQSMVEKVAQWLLESVKPRQKHFYEKAQHFLERKETNEAIKMLAQGYLYCLKDNISDDDEWFTKIRQLVLYDLTENQN